MKTTVLLEDRSLLSALLLSLLFFWRKGIQYALIGSYVPLLFPLVFTGIILLWARRGSIRLVLALKTWAVLLLLWAGARILFAAVNLTLQPFNEYHLSKQFGGMGILLSLLLFVCAIVLFQRLRLYRRAGLKHY